MRSTAHWSVPPRRLRLKPESKHAFRKAKATKTGVNDGKGAPWRVHWSAAETLAPEGTEAPESALQSNSALDAHARVSARGSKELSGRLQGVRITTGDRGG